jgi:molybdopterin/thiamine biosynthesis adenylyltransferase
MANHSALHWSHWPAREEATATRSDDPAPLRGWQGNPEKLATRSVLVFGLGAVGGVAFELLARLGVGDLLGVDPGSYGEQSWITQPIAASDTGRSKAQVQGERAHVSNPAVDVHTATGFAQDLPLRILQRADLFVAAGDNLDLVVWAGTLATGLGKPLLQGAVHPETWTAIVRAYELRNPEAACPACALGPRDWARLRNRAGCDPSAPPTLAGERTHTLPTLCGTAGHLLASGSLQWLLEDEQALCGQELNYCLRTHRVWRTDLPRRGRCRCPHQRWRVEQVNVGPEQCTPASLAERAGLPLDGLQVRSEVPWVRFALCTSCGTEVSVRRFARLGSTVGSCACGAALVAGPLGMCSVLPQEDLQACGDTPLLSLGLRGGDAVGMSASEDWTYFLTPCSPNEGSDE